ncbi:hypothetical protein WKW80_20155 [Variovorax humicola]|uniref:Uncharacterized protein n=1 Tax=Variovorax humicola TaxID=1769758 RepID=A0ABU8W2N5_9BURK
MSQNTHSSHEWWKDKSDPTELAAFRASYRENERERRRAGWRRNAMLLVLGVAMPVLFRLLVTL